MSRKKRKAPGRTPPRTHVSSPRDASAHISPSPPDASARRSAKVASTDPLELYRSLASPSMRMRWILITGLLLYIAADLVSIIDTKSLTTASDLALIGMIAILLFLGSGFIRHQRALFRIRRENPDAWQSSMRFAMSTLPIPLGFGGRPADSRERTMRRLTLLLLLCFAVAAIASSAHH